MKGVLLGVVVVLVSLSSTGLAQDSPEERQIASSISDVYDGQQLAPPRARTQFPNSRPGASRRFFRYRKGGRNDGNENNFGENPNESQGPNANNWEIDMSRTREGVTDGSVIDGRRLFHQGIRPNSRIGFRRRVDRFRINEQTGYKDEQQETYSDPLQGDHMDKSTTSTNSERTNNDEILQDSLTENFEVQEASHSISPEGPNLQFSVNQGKNSNNEESFAFSLDGNNNNSLLQSIQEVPEGENVNLGRNSANIISRPRFQPGTRRRVLGGNRRRLIRLRRPGAHRRYMLIGRQKEFLENKNQAILSTQNLEGNERVIDPSSLLNPNEKAQRMLAQGKIDNNSQNNANNQQDRHRFENSDLQGSLPNSHIFSERENSRQQELQRGSTLHNSRDSHQMDAGDNVRSLISKQNDRQYDGTRREQGGLLSRTKLRKPEHIRPQETSNTENKFDKKSEISTDSFPTFNLQSRDNVRSQPESPNGWIDGKEETILTNEKLTKSSETEDSYPQSSTEPQINTYPGQQFSNIRYDVNDQQRTNTDNDQSYTNQFRASNSQGNGEQNFNSQLNSNDQRLNQLQQQIDNQRLLQYPQKDTTDKTFADQLQERAKQRQEILREQRLLQYPQQRVNDGTYEPGVFERANDQPLNNDQSLTNTRNEFKPTLSQQRDQQLNVQILADQHFKSAQLSDAFGPGRAIWNRRNEQKFTSSSTRDSSPRQNQDIDSSSVKSDYLPNSDSKTPATFPLLRNANPLKRIQQSSLRQSSGQNSDIQPQGNQQTDNVQGANTPTNSIPSSFSSNINNQEISSRMIGRNDKNRELQLLARIPVRVSPSTDDSRLTKTSEITGEFRLQAGRTGSNNFRNGRPSEYNSDSQNVEGSSKISSRGRVQFTEKNFEGNRQQTGFDERNQEYALFASTQPNPTDSQLRQRNNDSRNQKPNRFRGDSHSSQFSQVSQNPNAQHFLTTSQHPNHGQDFENQGNSFHQNNHRSYINSGQVSSHAQDQINAQGGVERSNYEANQSDKDNFRSPQVSEVVSNQRFSNHVSNHQTNEEDFTGQTFSSSRQDNYSNQSPDNSNIYQFSPPPQIVQHDSNTRAQNDLLGERHSLSNNFDANSNGYRSQLSHGLSATGFPRGHGSTAFKEIETHRQIPKNNRPGSSGDNIQERPGGFRGEETFSAQPGTTGSSFHKGQERSSFTGFETKSQISDYDESFQSNIGRDHIQNRPSQLGVIGTLSAQFGTTEGHFHREQEKPTFSGIENQGPIQEHNESFQRNSGRDTIQQIPSAVGGVESYSTKSRQTISSFHSVQERPTFNGIETQDQVPDHNESFQRNSGRDNIQKNPNRFRGIGTLSVQDSSSDNLDNFKQKQQNSNGQNHYSESETLSGHGYPERQVPSYEKANRVTNAHGHPSFTYQRQFSSFGGTENQHQQEDERKSKEEIMSNSNSDLENPAQTNFRHSVLIEDDNKHALQQPGTMQDGHQPAGEESPSNTPFSPNRGTRKFLDAFSEDRSTLPEEELIRKIAAVLQGRDSFNNRRANKKGRKTSSAPRLTEIPDTDFHCEGRVSGYYADSHEHAKCQSFHFCGLDGAKISYLCPAGTIFNQRLLVCDHSFRVECSTSPDFYYVNERLYGANVHQPVRDPSRAFRSFGRRV